MELNATTHPAPAEAPARPPGLRDRGLRWILIGVFALQLFTWSGVEGYQLADSVEYMELAQAWVRGEEVVDSTDIRPYGFVLLLAPLFWLAELVGLEQFEFVVSLVRVLQMCLGLVLVWACARIGARLGGRRAGLATAVIVGVNPYFLQYSVSPVSGIAATLCLAFAVERLLQNGRPRDGFIGGLWLGLALLVAYKTLLIGAPIIVAVVLRDRLKRSGCWLAVLGGYAVGVVAAIALDKLAYGEFGRSFEAFLRQTFGVVATRYTARFGFRDLALWFWEWSNPAGQSEFADNPDSAPASAKAVEEAYYYLRHLHQVIVWPLLLLGVWGLGASLRKLVREPLRRFDGRAWLLVFVLAGGLVIISLRSNKGLRLLLPLLPVFAPLCGLGFVALAGTVHEPWHRLRHKLAAGLLFLAACLGLVRLEELNTSRYAGYWRALELVDELARRDGAGEHGLPPWRVACAWHWAVYLRNAPHTELVKLPHQLEYWRSYTEAARANDLGTLAELDAFICHLGLLNDNPTILEAMNEGFEVSALLYDREQFEGSGPILVFRRRGSGGAAFAFQDVLDCADPLGFVAEHGLVPGRRFVPDRADGSGPPASLLGWSYRGLPGDGHGWLSLYWFRGPRTEPGLHVTTRIHTPYRPEAWEEQHVIGRGLASTARWTAGKVLVEGWPVEAAVAPFDSSQEFRPLYYAEGDARTQAAELWLRLFPDHEAEPVPMLPLSELGEPIRERDLNRHGRAPDGTRMAGGGFVLLGKFDLVLPD